MKVLLSSLLWLVTAFGSAPLPAPAQGRAPLFVPDTSVELPFEAGNRAHTNHVIRIIPNGGLGPNGGMTPAQLRSFYSMPSTGGSGVIAIVDAFHYPTALNDFNVFSAQFNLPIETSNNATASTNAVFQVVYARGKKPRTNAGWAQEAALDIEWAHAMAPNAKIVLVEADSNSYASLMAAVDVASKLPGVRQVSMSWSSSEFSGETSYDSHFQQSGVVYFASSGDVGGVVQYPAVSPYVVAVGGTSVSTNSSGAFVSEKGWSGSGGGTSRYEPKPTYQSGLPATMRVVPDISSDADPYTGVAVYDSTPYQGLSGWLVFGGTSVSSPCMAGMVNLAGYGATNSYTELTRIYSALGTANFRDITSGSAGSFTAVSGWDFVTGVGAPLGFGGI